MVLRNRAPLAFWTHPIHIHFEEFRALTRNGAAPPPLETGRKDVLNLPPETEAEVFIRFRDFRGKYQLHCHRMNHEDNLHAHTLGHRRQLPGLRGTLT